MNRSQYIEHTFLKAEGTHKEIDKIISEAKEYSFKGICINPSWIEYAKPKLAGTDVLLVTVIGFPLGAMATEAKAFEAKHAVQLGADEVDMVLNIGRLKQADHTYVEQDIKAVKDAIGNKNLKVIVEAALLTDKEIKKATELVMAAGADFVKTSTGFSTRGALPNDIKIMHSVTQGKIGIKAAGGVSTPEQLDEMISLGANRIGTSRGVALVEGKKANGGY